MLWNIDLGPAFRTNKTQWTIQKIVIFSKYKYASAYCFLTSDEEMSQKPANPIGGMMLRGFFDSIN